MLPAGNRAEAGESTDGPVVVVGAAGQLGQTMVARLGERWTTIALTRTDLDLTDGPAVRDRLTAIAPTAIINCAGFNQVDLAEEQPEAAMDANALAVLTLARAAHGLGATLVHYSSDFVFDGDTSRPYDEADRPAPQSVYAASKLLGEWFAADAPAHYVLRVESLFGGIARRKSSLDRIIATIAAGEPTRVFVDRVVSPSYAWDVADATAALLQRRPPAGIYHCVNTGAATWHDVAIEVRRLLGAETLLVPIRVTDVQLAAARPRYCALANDKLRGAGIDMPTWQDALRRCLRDREGDGALGEHQRRTAHGQ